MRDVLERPLRDLRISLTDRCNMRCRYCMPREVFGASYSFLADDELLSFTEIARVAAAAAALGVRKLRLTGGEPLLRAGVQELTGMLAAVDGIEDLAMTTNGLLLERHAAGLAAAGLKRVTISLDSLDDAVLAEMSDVPVTAGRVLGGIEAALAAGLQPVKVNMVVRRGMNEGCIVEMARHFRDLPVTLRFIEYMDVGESNGWLQDDVVSCEEILAAIESEWPLEALAPSHPGEVASRYRYRDGAGEIGVIHSVSAPFCGSCTRARLSADGKLFTCLFAGAGTDLRELLRGGAGQEALEALLAGVWRERRDRYSELRAERAGVRRVEMSYIGG